MDLRPEPLLGKTVKFIGAVTDMVRDQIHHTFFAPLYLALNKKQPATHHLLSELIENRRPDHNVANAGFIAKRDEYNAGSPRHLSYQHHACAHRALRISCGVDFRAAENTFAAKQLSQELHRVALERQADGLVIREYMLACWHQRQWSVAFCNHVRRFLYVE